MSVSVSSISSVTREDINSSEVSMEFQGRKIPRNLLTWCSKKETARSEAEERYKDATSFDIENFPKDSYSNNVDLERWKTYMLDLRKKIQRFGMIAAKKICFRILRSIIFT